MLFCHLGLIHNTLLQIADSSQTVHTKDAFRQVYSWFRSTSMMAEPGGSSLVSAVNIDTDYDGRLLILPKDDEEFAATPPSPSELMRL